MLKLLKKETNIIIILSIIILNYIFFALSLPSIILKINFLFYFLFVSFYFQKFEKNKFLIVFVIFLLIISLGTLTNSWDARSIWLFKAKVIFYDNSIFSIKNNYATFSHPDYPNIAPSFAAGFVNLIGYWNEIFPKTAFTLIFIPPLIILSNFFKDKYFYLVLSLSLFIIGKFFVNGELDGLVSIFFSVSALSIFHIINDKNNLNQNYLIILLLLLIFTMLKLESLFLLISIVASTFLIFLKKKFLNKKLIFIFLISIIPIIIWHIFCSYHNISNQNSDYNYNIESFYSRFMIFENYILIFKYLILNEKFLFSLIFFLITSFYSSNKNNFIYVISISIIYISILFFVYLSTPLDFDWHLNSSAARIIKPIALLLSIFGVYNINKKLKFIR
jgi:hypothetical protein